MTPEIKPIVTASFKGLVPLIVLDEWQHAVFFTARNVTLRVAYRLECAGAQVKFTPAPIDRTWGVLCFCGKPFQSICDGVWFHLL